MGAPVYTQGSTGWITSATLNETTAPATLTIQPSTAALPAGTHVVQIPVTSAQASNSPQSAQITVNVSTGPIMQLSTNLVEITRSVGAAIPDPVTIMVTNAGGGSLGFVDGAVVEYDGPFAWVAGGFSNTAIGLSFLRTNELPVGTYTARAIVFGMNVPEQTIIIRFTVTP